MNPGKGVSHEGTQASNEGMDMGKNSAAGAEE